MTARALRVGLDAHVVGRRKTGNETYAIGLAHALARRSDVDLIAYVDRGAAWPRDPSSTIGVRRLRTRSRVARLAAELPVRAVRDRLDILHLQYVSPPLLSVPAAVAVHDVSFLDRPELFPTDTRVRLRATVAASVRRAGVVLALSEFTRDRLLDHYQLDPARVAVVPAGIEPPAAARGAERSEAAALGGPTAGSPPARDGFVLHVGDITPRKNIARLVEAVARVRAVTGMDVGLVLAGQTGQGGAKLVSSAIERLPVADDRQGGWVTHLGYVNGSVLETLYRHAAVVAQPSLYEGFGLPALEAMARGAVVVTSDTSAIPEVVGDGAILAAPEDIASLAAALERALTDGAERERLRHAGPARAAVYTWDAAARHALHAYRVASGR